MKAMVLFSQAWPSLSDTLHTHWRCARPCSSSGRTQRSSPPRLLLERRRLRTCVSVWTSSAARVCRASTRPRPADSSTRTTRELNRNTLIASLIISTILNALPIKMVASTSWSPTFPLTPFSCRCSWTMWVRTHFGHIRVQNMSKTCPNGAQNLFTCPSCDQNVP